VAEISEYVNIAIGTFIACEYIVVRYYYNLFTIPNLQRNNAVKKSQILDLGIIAYTENDTSKPSKTTILLWITWFIIHNIFS